MSNQCEEHKIEFILGCALCKHTYCMMCIKTKPLCSNLGHKLFDYKDYQVIINEEEEKKINQKLRQGVKDIEKFQQGKEKELEKEKENLKRLNTERSKILISFQAFYQQQVQLINKKFLAAKELIYERIRILKLCKVSNKIMPREAKELAKLNLSGKVQILNQLETFEKLMAKYLPYSKCVEVHYEIPSNSNIFQPKLLEMKKAFEVLMQVDGNFLLPYLKANFNLFEKAILNKGRILKGNFEFSFKLHILNPFEKNSNEFLFWIN